MWLGIVFQSFRGVRVCRVGLDGIGGAVIFKSFLNNQNKLIFKENLLMIDFYMSIATQKNKIK